jgi:hypothetical protein
MQKYNYFKKDNFQSESEMMDAWSFSSMKAPCQCCLAFVDTSALNLAKYYTKNKKFKEILEWFG